MLAITQPLRVGDWVFFEDQYGVVDDIRLNYTFLRTAGDQRIVIPNEQLASGILRNDTLGDGLVGLDVAIWLPPTADAGRAVAVAARRRPASRSRVAETTVGRRPARRRGRALPAARARGARGRAAAAVPRAAARRRPARGRPSRACRRRAANLPGRPTIDLFAAHEPRAARKAAPSRTRRSAQQGLPRPHGAGHPRRARGARAASPTSSRSPPRRRRCRRSSRGRRSTTRACSPPTASRSASSRPTSCTCRCAPTRSRRSSRTPRSRSRTSASTSTRASTTRASSARRSRTSPRARRSRAARRSRCSSSARSTSPTSARTTRKIREAKLAEELEDEHSKEWILEKYLDSIPYGTVGGQSAIGVKAAARIYFSKDVNDLTLREAALLAGLPQAPTAYSPTRAARRPPRRAATRCSARWPSWG